MCYLKYEKNEEEELINEIENNSNMNILNVNSIKSPTQKLSTSFDIKKNNNSKNGNSLFCFELVFPKKSVKFFVEDQQKYNEFITSIKHIISYREISEFEFYVLKFGVFEFYTLTFYNLDFTP